MFCSKCGNQINGKLKYCNVCGAKLTKNDWEDAFGTTASASPLNSLITALPFIALGGFGILIALLALLLKQGVSNEAVGIIAFFYLAALTAICFSLNRTMSKLIELKVKEKAESLNEVIPPVQLPAVNTAQLEEMRQPFSVVDNTTRTFEKVPLKEN